MPRPRYDFLLRAVSSAGRAPALQAGGRWFEPGTAHRHVGVPTVGWGRRRESKWPERTGRMPLKLESSPFKIREGRTIWGCSLSRSPQPGFHIFLSYRRDETASHAGRLWDSLLAGVGEHSGFSDEQIFMDIDTIELGEDFREAIAGAVQKCDVFLVVIGRGWVDVKDARGRRRLNDPSDFVRLEVEAALKRKVPVIPVLVGGASMPSEKGLPESMSELVYKQAVELGDKSWRHDVGGLLASLKKREARLAADAPGLLQRQLEYRMGKRGWQPPGTVPTQGERRLLDVAYGTKQFRASRRARWRGFLKTHREGQVVVGRVIWIANSRADVILSRGIFGAFFGRTSGRASRGGTHRELRTLSSATAGVVVVRFNDLVRVRIGAIPDSDPEADESYCKCGDLLDHQRRCTRRFCPEGTTEAAPPIGLTLLEVLPPDTPAPHLPPPPDTPNVRRRR
jgi:hypothetical protein